MSGKTKDVEYRRQQIMKLGYMIQVCFSFDFVISVSQRDNAVHATYTLAEY